MKILLMSLRASLSVVALIFPSLFVPSELQTKPVSMSARALCRGFAPENTLQIPVGSNVLRQDDSTPAFGLSEEQFHHVLDQLERLYSEDVQNLGGMMRMQKYWFDITVNAEAKREGNEWIVTMYGGLARHPTMTMDGFALVACHELGHHLGGTPHYGENSYGEYWNWGTTEGGADYFATLKCLRHYFASEKDKPVVAGENDFDPVAKARCSESFANDGERAICLRISRATQSAAHFLSAINGETLPDFGTPDTNVRETTYDGHPPVQCRMDTYFAGSLCLASVSAPLSNQDYRVGSCFQPHDLRGFRPYCWFKPRAM